MCRGAGDFGWFFTGDAERRFLLRGESGRERFLLSSITAGGDDLLTCLSSSWLLLRRLLLTWSRQLCLSADDNDTDDSRLYER